MKFDIWGFSKICSENSSFIKIGREYKFYKNITRNQTTHL